MELIEILDAARRRLGDNDKAFGKWLASNGYGENRISRQDRAALLNMAENSDATRAALEKTERWSWRNIWTEEVQPGLPSPGQPTDAKEGKPAKTTRRPKKASGGKKHHTVEWFRDRRRFFADGLVAANRVIKMKDDLEECDAKQRRQMQEHLREHPTWLKSIAAARDALEWIGDWFIGSAEEAEPPRRNGRTKMTLAA